MLAFVWQARAFGIQLGNLGGGGGASGRECEHETCRSDALYLEGGGRDRGGYEALEGERRGAFEEP